MVSSIPSLKKNDHAIAMFMARELHVWMRSRYAQSQPIRRVLEMNDPNMFDESDSKSTKFTTKECAAAGSPLEKCADIKDDPEGIRKAMEACPMASMCKSMSKEGRKSTGFTLLVPGIIMILVGILIILQPVILAWLIAATSIVLGIFALLMGNAFRKFMAHM